MPNMYDVAGRALRNSNYKSVAAGVTTQQISTPADAIVGRDYISHVICTAASTAAPGAITLFDGTTQIFKQLWNATVATDLCQTIIVDCVCESTKGFNITTGSSVSCVAVGRFTVPGQ